MLALLGIALVATLVIVAWKAGNANKPAIVGLRSTPTTGATQPKRRAALVARLEVTAREATTLQVHRRSSTGPLVFEGTLDKGKRMVFVGRRLWLDVARPGALSAKLDGRVVRLPGGVKSVVVTARGIRPSSGA
jgi:hypothetical protein